MAFKDIDRASVLKAIQEYDELGRDAFLGRYGFGTAHSYLLRHNGKSYDSKAIVGVAHLFAVPTEGALSSREFTGGAATVAPLLERLGFEVSREAPADRPSASLRLSDTGRAFWWVNNKQTYKHEVGGNYLWSPIATANGRQSVFYDNMTRVRVGDVVFAFAGAQIKAVGVCSAPAVLMPKPDEFGAAGDVWLDEGWQVSVAFTALANPIRVKDHMDMIGPTLPVKYSPIRDTGDGNQGAYLAAVPREMAEAVIALIGPEWRRLDVQARAEIDTAGTAAIATEDAAEAAIRNRTDIDETEKLSLVQSRRGQGIYRANLARFETTCRVTGLSDPRHLRASHIKPWRLANRFEKLDGNNGLLLSPHVDHLFDQGYISFSDDGAMIVSPAIQQETLERWSIDPGRNCGAFRAEQRPYLAFHREFIFKS